MSSLRRYPATVLAIPLALLSIVYTILTPTNIVLGLIPILLFLGVAQVVDRTSISLGTPSENPATLVALPIAIAVGLLTILTQTWVLLGFLSALLLLALGALYDRAPISLRAPRQCRATIVALFVIVLLGAYSILTPTNVLLWVVAASSLLGIGILLDWLAFDDED